MQLNLLLIISLFLNLQANAKFYPLNDNKNTEVIIIDNPLDDEYVRLNLLMRARKSIDIISHTQTSKGFGLKIINVLRNRMSHGVKVRYLYEKIASMGVGEITDKATNLITDNELYTKSNSELIVVRPLEKLLSPYTASDLFHEKKVIIDRGTENEIIIIGGRNHDDFSETSSDFTFILRRIDRYQTYLGDALQHHFNNLFTTAKKYFSVESGSKISIKEKYALTQKLHQLKYSAPSSLATEILQVLRQPHNPSKSLKPFQFIPEKVRLITNDLLKNIADNNLPKTYLIREDMLNDDITTYFAGLVENASRLEVTSYILAFPELIKNSVKNLLANGGEFVSYSNNGQAYGLKLPFKSLGNTVHAMNIESYFNFIESATNNNSVKMYNLDPSKGLKQDAPVDYNHRKVALLDIKAPSTASDSKPIKRIVFTGSYNYTLSSASKNDELAVMFSSTEMADYISSINKRDADAYYFELDPVQAREIWKNNKTPLQLCRKIFESIF